MNMHTPIRRTARGRVWTPADIDEVIRLYEAGTPLRDMADHFGVSFEAMKSRLRGIAERTRRHPRRDELAELMSLGLTLTQAAARLGMSYGTAKSTWQRIKAGLGEQAR